MADQETVRRLALALPYTAEEDGRFAFAVFAGGKLKGFAWSWLERVAPKKPRVPRADVLAVRVAGEAAKQALLAADADTFFTEPHYDGYPAVLVRLDRVADAELARLLTEAWRCQAPKAVVRAFDSGQA